MTMERHNQRKFGYNDSNGSTVPDITYEPFLVGSCNTTVSPRGSICHESADRELVNKKQVVMRGRCIARKALKSMSTMKDSNACPLDRRHESAATMLSIPIRKPSKTFAETEAVVSRSSEERFRAHSFDSCEVLVPDLIAKSEHDTPVMPRRQLSKADIELFGSPLGLQSGSLDLEDVFQSVLGDDEWEDDEQEINVTPCPNLRGGTGSSTIEHSSFLSGFSDTGASTIQSSALFSSVSSIESGCLDDSASPCMGRWDPEKGTSLTRKTPLIPRNTWDREQVEYFQPPRQDSIVMRSIHEHSFQSMVSIKEDDDSCCSDKDESVASVEAMQVSTTSRVDTDASLSSSSSKHSAPPQQPRRIPSTA